MTDMSVTQIRRLDFTLLLVLHGVLQHGRTTVVADELGLSQSAISHALRRLRDVFGEPLFIRRPHGLEPTPRARALAPQIEALIRGAEAALGREAFDPAASARSFRIGATDYLAQLLSPPLLEAFAHSAPRARFAMHVVRGADALAALRRHEIDIAIGRFARATTGLQARPLFTDQFCVVARASNRAVPARLTKAQFEKLGHVTISVTGDFRSITDEDVRALGLARRVVATAPTFSTAFAIVSRTDAIAIAPSRLAARFARAFRLKTAALPRPLGPLKIAAITRPTRDDGVDWLAARLTDAALAD